MIINFEKAGKCIVHSADEDVLHVLVNRCERTVKWQSVRAFSPVFAPVTCADFTGFPNFVNSPSEQSIIFASNLFSQ